MTQSMRRPTSRDALVVLGLAVSGVFAYLAVRNVDFDEVWDALSAMDYWWLVPAFVALAVANLVRAWRWQYLFDRETRPPFRPALSAYLIGTFFNNVLPARAGEAAQVVAVRQRAGTSAAEATGTVVLGRAYDVLSVLVLLFVLLPWLPEVSWLRAAGILAVALAAALVLAALALWVFGDRPLRAVLRPLARLPYLTVARTERAAVGLVRGLVSLRSAGLGLVALALTTAAWIVFGISNWLVMEGFDLGLSPLAGILVTIAIGLATILPSSPAAVGVFEAAVLVALDAYGVPKSEALSYAIVLHALNFFPYLAAGALVLQPRRPAV